MVTGINNIVDATAGGTDMMVKETFQRILEATPPPKYNTYKHINI